MNTLRKTLCTFALGLTLCSVARAALPIELEVAIESGASLTAPQEWSAVLGRMNLASVRLRAIRPTDQPKISTSKIGNSSRYQVLAILSRGDQLVFPQQKFRASDRRALQAFFEQLPTEVEHTATPRGRFDLTEPQFKNIYADFSLPVSFETKGISTRDLLNRLQERITTPVEIAPQAKSLLLLPLKAELKDLSSGTALAIALREHGLELRPEQPRGKPLRLLIDTYDRELDCWPVGWKPEKSMRLVAPSLFKKLTLEASNIRFEEVLTQLQPQLKVPVVLDHWIIDQHKKPLLETSVKLARRKTYLKGALDRLAGQARLATELRVDESGKPFLWITQFGKDSSRL